MKKYIIIFGLLIVLGGVICWMIYPKESTETIQASLTTWETYIPTNTMHTVTALSSLPDQSDVSIEGTIAWYIQQLDPTGGIIRVPAGEYLFKDAVILQSNIAIIGDGDETIFRMSNESTDTILRNTFVETEKGPGIKQVYLEGFRMEGNPSRRRSCLDITADGASRSSDITITNVAAHHCGQHGIHIKGAIRVDISHLNLSSSGQNPDHDHNLYLLRVTDAHVRYIQTTQSTGNGFSSTGLHSVLIEDVVTTQNGRRGFRTAGSDNVIIRRITSIGNGVAPDGRGGDGIIITTDDKEHPNTNMTIEDCQSTQNRSQGIKVISVANMKISNCTIAENIEYGLAILHTTGYTLIQNTIQGNEKGNLFTENSIE